MKKILVVSSYPAPYRVGVFAGLTRHYDMDIFFEFDQDQSRSDEWFVREDWFHILTRSGQMDIFNACLRDIRQYDLVLAYDYNNKNAGRAIRRCMTAGIPYCINCDGAFIHRNLLKDIVKRLYISHARACFASGQHAEDYFLHYGAKPENIYRHRFTSMSEKDMEQAYPVTGEEKKNLRKELSLPADCVIVLSIGQFIPRKGLDILLKAWAGIGVTGAALVIIGGGEEENTYKDLIDSLNLRNVMLRGFMPGETVYDHYRAADIFVLPTREDIWGLVINEAMAFGLPVISTEGCIAALELIKNDINGYVVPVDDESALRQRLAFLTENPDIRQKMGAKNRNDMQGCTIEQIVQRHVEVIDSL